MSTLTLQGLSKHYPKGERPAVADVSLTVPQGSLFALLGESGSGKTTLLRMAAGLELPDGGEIKVGDRKVFGPGTNLQPQKRGIGLVFQSGALFPHLRVADNVAYGMSKIPKGERRQSIDTLLEMVGLGGYGNRYPSELSGGEAQRVALARALAPDPDVLLLDEPFSSLDTTLRKRLRDEVGEVLRKTNTTALLVTHDTEDALAIADEIAVMRKGQLLQVGEPATLYRDPRDAYCANLFGPANRLPENWGTPSSATEGWIWVRPEDMEVLNQQGDDRLQVKVLAKRYLGTRLELKTICSQLGDGELGELTLYWEGEGEPEIGQPLWVKPRS